MFSLKKPQLFFRQSVGRIFKQCLQIFGLSDRIAGLWRPHLTDPGGVLVLDENQQHMNEDTWREKLMLHLQQNILATEDEACCMLLTLTGDDTSDAAENESRSWKALQPLHTP